ATNAIDDVERHSPGARTGDAPVGTVLQQAADPLPAPARDPLDAVHLLQGDLAEVVGLHGDEPLTGGAEDDRVGTAPAMRIGVLDLAVLEQVAARAEHLDDARDRKSTSLNSSHVKI